MKILIAELRTAILVTLVFAVLLCGVYPLAVWAGGQALFAGKANGSLLTDQNGTVVGSALLAQNFTSEKYFHPRPSAAGTGYDAASSSGTNLGPTSKKLADALAANVAAYRTKNNLAPEVPVPADAVTSSGSGLDPHISLANAQLQTPRVAAARRLAPEQLAALVATHTEGRDFALFGEARVNVLTLNRALDAATTNRAP